MKTSKPNKRILRASIRGSVPDGKLKRARIILSGAKHGERNIAGFTEYSQEKGHAVAKLGAPSGDNAFDITVRGHETRHATKHKPSRRKPVTGNELLAGQIVDDVNVETMPLPIISTSGIETYRRAHLATALNDVRTLISKHNAVTSGKAPDTIEHRNGQLLLALRCKAMLAHYRDGGLPKTIRQAAKGSRVIREIIGAETSKALHKIIGMAKLPRHRERAISALVALMEAQSAEDNDQEEMEIPLPKGDLLSPVVHGDALDGHMTIINLLPKSAFTAKEKRVSRRTSPDGVILNPARFVNAIAANDSNGLFARRVRQKAGGTIVIDASGSMGATQENLAALCRICPTATVAYYSGTDVGGVGTLAIYAYDGKRFDGVLPEKTLIGGNSVDLPALRWLLKQARPHTLISDLEFCGGVIGSEIIAHAIVERGVQRGDLTVHHSLDAAYEAFGGKGSLQDAAYPHQKDGWELRKTIAALKSAAEAKNLADVEKSEKEREARRAKIKKEDFATRHPTSISKAKPKRK